MVIKKSLINQFVEQLQELPENLKRRVLDFVNKLKAVSQHEMPGKQMLQFAGSIPQEDLEVMLQAIYKGCEQEN